jgi:hypothetical protein
MTRLKSAILVMMILSLTSGASADDRENASIASALSFLAGEQNFDGSFSTGEPRFTTTAASLLAFLSAGDTSEGGRYAVNVRRATEFLLRQAPPDHNFGRADPSGVDGQATVTLAMCEAYGVESDDATRAKILAVVKYAVAILLTEKPGESRLAALRAARRVGLTIPEAAVTQQAPSTAPTTQTILSESARRQLLDQQLSDGGWPAAGADASSRVRETARAVLLLTRRWKLSPLD